MLTFVSLVAWAMALGSMGVFAQTSCASEFTVQAGDTCAIIAAQFGITIVQLEAANPSINSGCTNLAIGEVLCIPAAAVCPSGVFFIVQSGDVCTEIAIDLGVTVAALQASNPQIDAACDNLFVGEQLCVPGAATSTLATTTETLTETVATTGTQTILTTGTETIVTTGTETIVTVGTETITTTEIIIEATATA